MKGLFGARSTLAGLAILTTVADARRVKYLPRQSGDEAPREIFRLLSAARRTHLWFPSVASNIGRRLTPGITRRARNGTGIPVLRMKAALFAVGCMPLLGAALSSGDALISGQV